MNKITFFGDVKIDTPSDTTLSDGLKEIIGSSEYNVVNFEAPVKTNFQPIEKSGPNNCQNINTPAWLEKNGFNVVSFANNHLLDFGNDALKLTMDLFNNTYVVGAGKWEDAYNPLILNLSDGSKIGIIACTHCEFGTLCEKSLCKDNLGAAWMSNPIINSLIVNIKQEVDYLFVYVHAGVEFMQQPLPELRDLYRNFVDLGADAVIASHPHIPLGWEEYKNKIILYSLGNFCFQKPEGWKYREHWNDSLAISFNLIDGNLNYTITNITYNCESKTLCLNKSKEFDSYIKSLNSVLREETLYINYVNEYAVNMLPYYLKTITTCGYYQNITFCSILKTIKHKIQNTKISYSTFLNNYQCESHRWLIIRGLKLKYKFL